jgi:hypothetical protein
MTSTLAALALFCGIGFALLGALLYFVLLPQLQHLTEATAAVEHGMARQDGRFLALEKTTDSVKWAADQHADAMATRMRVASEAMGEVYELLDQIQREGRTNSAFITEFSERIARLVTQPEAPAAAAPAPAAARKRPGRPAKLKTAPSTTTPDPTPALVDPNQGALPV